jgi:hypothetical protein
VSKENCWLKFGNTCPKSPALLLRCRMSALGPLRHFAATQQFGRFRSEADIQRAALTELDL